VLQTQAALDVSRDRYAALYELAPVGYLTLADDGLIAEVNLTAASLLGVERKRLLGSRFERFVAAKDLDCWHQLSSGIRRETSRQGCELAMCDAHGHLFHARLDCRCEQTAGGRAEIWLAFTDISQLREDEERRRAELAEQRDALVREMHHRIKNNLQSVAGLLRRELGRFVELNPRLEAAIGQVSAIAGAHGIQSTNADETVRLCASVLDICHTVAGLTQRAVLFHPPAEQGEPLRMEGREAIPVALVINELVLNAVKHSPAGHCPMVSLSTSRFGAELVIRNALQSTSEFDIDSGQGLGTGLRLVRSLLPRRGAQLVYRQEATDWMLTSLTLSTPVVVDLRREEPGYR